MAGLDSKKKASGLIDIRQPLPSYTPTTMQYGGQSTTPSSIGTGASRGQTVMNGINYVKDQQGNVVMKFGHERDGF